MLAALHLLDFIHKCNPRLPLSRTFANNLKHDNSKENVILLNIIIYYQFYLKCNISNHFNIETINPEDEFEEVKNFC